MTQKAEAKLSSFHSLNEELANVITHGIGAGMSIVGLVVLVVVASWQGDIYRIVSVSVYGGSLVLLYMASTLFHSVQRPTVPQAVRDWFQTFDHVAIYILIAGTYTPLLLVKLRGNGGWTMFAIVWGLALFGSILKSFFRNRYTLLSTGAYLLMGWMAIFLLGRLNETMGSGVVIWVLVGGVFYSLGVIPFLMNKLPYNHAIWHLFVMGGSICHFLAVLLYVMPETL